MRHTVRAWFRALTPRQAAALLALLTAFTGIAITVTGPGDDPGSITITIPLQTTVDATGDGNRDTPLVVHEQAAEQVAGQVAEGELASPLREKDDPSNTPPGVLEGPHAAQEFPGCRTRFVGNYSSRNGAAVRIIVLHQTVSRERGWSSQDALTSYANQRSSGVSWHLLIGPTNGYCTHSVPLHMKAWTQSNANPFSIGIEVERFGDERSYVEGAGRTKLVAILRELGRRFDIPMREGKVVNCRVVTPGIVEHSDLGVCGGGHADVTPWSTDDLIREAAKTMTTKYPARRSTLTKAERGHVDRLEYERRIAKRHGGWSKIHPSHLRVAKASKTWLIERQTWLKARLSRKAHRAERYRVIRAVMTP